MGTAAAADDELDLSACTCNPHDPALSRILLGEFALRGLEQLRDWRRYRLVQKDLVDRIVTLTRAMSSSATRMDPRDREAWLELNRLVDNLNAKLRARPPAPASEELVTRAEEVRAEVRQIGSSSLLPFKLSPPAGTK